MKFVRPSLAKREMELGLTSFQGSSSLGEHPDREVWPQLPFTVRVIFSHYWLVTLKERELWIAMVLGIARCVQIEHGNGLSVFLRC